MAKTQKNELEEFDKELEELERKEQEFNNEINKIVNKKTAAEVSGRSNLCNTIEKKELINVDRNEDGTVQNPTIQREAQELTDKYGKKSRK